MTMLAWLAYRTRTMNRLFGTTMSPEQLAVTFPNEDVDILLAYDEYMRDQR